MPPPPLPPPPHKVLPAPPEPPEAELAAWKAEHASASDDEVKQFVTTWQEAWKQQNWPSGTNHWRNKKVGLPDGELYEAVVLGVDPGSDPAFREGRFTIQDEASQLVVELLDPQPGEHVLDLCAAPGAKTTAIAEP